MRRLTLFVIAGGLLALYWTRRTRLRTVLASGIANETGTAYSPPTDVIAVPNVPVMVQNPSGYPAPRIPPEWIVDGVLTPPVMYTPVSSALPPSALYA